VPSRGTRAAPESRAGPACAAWPWSRLTSPGRPRGGDPARRSPATEGAASRNAHADKQQFLEGELVPSTVQGVELEVPVRARRRAIGAAGIRGQRLDGVERRHAGDCMTASTGAKSHGDTGSDARWGARGGRTPALRIRGPPFPRRESATDVRLDGDEVAADADDGDAGHRSGTYMEALPPSRHHSPCDSDASSSSAMSTTRRSSERIRATSFSQDTTCPRDSAFPGVRTTVPTPIRQLVDGLGLAPPVGVDHEGAVTRV
jgi:hypothetical protein